ncbi:tRNA 4-thiouridine(8) synthase ThiI [Candidatus Micrarchaeota archaeon]|nr:tRNA 4-thiouridine(8) synthase ThiI [Candidatus Micrarchaeota archaeon]
MLVLVQYGEIGIKGKNRRTFENMLIRNIRKALGAKLKDAELRESRVFLEVEGKEKEIRKALLAVFGIEWFAFAYECRKTADEIWKVVQKAKLKGKKIAVETKRVDKSFPMKSQELSAEIGARIVEKFGCGVDLENPDARISIIIARNAYVYFEKIRGLGGLPVGSSGRVLCLLSGGIDSPVAAWMLMKRGCRVDFLHIYPFEKWDAKKGKKILELIEKLEEYGGKAELLTIPYADFYAETGNISPGYELVVFRRYMYKLAEKIAQEKGYGAIVSGDSLGQVASQTLENIGASQWGLSVPVFRPLIGMDKNEIIELAEKIGTYEISIRPYKDCCSLVSISNPVTRARREEVERFAELIGLEKLVEKGAGRLSKHI